MEFKFKQENKDFEKRRKMYFDMKQKFPVRIPIVCEKDSQSKAKDINKTKYLINRKATAIQFYDELRKQNNIQKEEALFLLVNGKYLIAGDINLGEIYDKYHDKDGFLYIVYSCELIWENIYKYTKF